VPVETFILAAGGRFIAAFGIFVFLPAFGAAGFHPLYLRHLSPPLFRINSQSFFFKYANARYGADTGLNLSLSIMLSLVVRMSSEFQIVYSVVFSISIDMVDYLPRMKASAEMFCHNQSMCQNTTCGVSHRVKEIIWLKQHGDITIIPLACSILPPPIFGTFTAAGKA